MQVLPKFTVKDRLLKGRTAVKEMDSSSKILLIQLVPFLVPPSESSYFYLLLMYSLKASLKKKKVNGDKQLLQYWKINV